LRLIERYLLFYSITILVSGLLLTVINVRQIEVYYAVYLIEFLVALQLLASFRRSFERNVRPVVFAFLVGFAYIIAQRILQILS
jgi:hypothetical protein